MKPYHQIRQGCALIRHIFPTVDLDKISDDDFAMMYHDAAWVCDYRNPFSNFSETSNKK